MADSGLVACDKQLAMIERELTKRLPGIGFYKFAACGSCGVLSYIYPIFDPATGMPTCEYAATMVVAGDGQSSWFDGGTAPRVERGLEEHDHGCRVISIRVDPRSSCNELRKEVLRAAALLTA